MSEPSLAELVEQTAQQPVPDDTMIGATVGGFVDDEGHPVKDDPRKPLQAQYAERGLAWA